MKKFMLEDGFEAIVASQEEFGRYHTIYKLGPSNVWFPVSMQSCMNLYAGFENPYWIYLNGMRIGGALIEPNWFGLYFIISPFEDEFKLLKRLLKLVRKISDPNKPIIAYGIHHQSIPYLQKLGFQIEEMEKLMICATEPYEIIWNEKIYCDTVKENELEEMVDLYYSVYRKSHVESVARKKYEFYDELLKNQIKEVNLDYSSIIHDSKTHEIVAACLVQEWEELPFILDIVVNPIYQNQGIGEMMIKKVLHLAKEQYPAVRLSVNPGNPAEYLYHKLGFIGGTITYQLKLNV